ncbi:CopG family ribbon-helix-helix protein [Desulfovibrio sp. SGI.169]|uniref:CopG family ribbon-helix-helix protein n=1 Tax=Desulfovibrio sp. SGI.169 TaxID=3420561 RepID=UPI003CFDDF90
MQAQTSPISIRLPAELKARVQGLAVMRQRSTNALVVQAVTAFVEREEKREALRQECLAAHEHYQQTGLHVTQAEVKDWIALLRQGKQADAPKCHI